MVSINPPRTATARITTVPALPKAVRNGSSIQRPSRPPTSSSVERSLDKARWWLKASPAKKMISPPASRRQGSDNGRSAPRDTSQMPNTVRMTAATTTPQPHRRCSRPSHQPPREAGCAEKRPVNANKAASKSNRPPIQ
jgi:hypothetical protein